MVVRRYVFETHRLLRQHAADLWADYFYLPRDHHTTRRPVLYDHRIWGTVRPPKPIPFPRKC